MQDFLTSNLDWAAAQASQSRTRVEAEGGGSQTDVAATASISQGQVEAAEASNVRLASNNPFAAVLSGEVPASALDDSTKSTTEEEDILSEILTATSEVRLRALLPSTSEYGADSRRFFGGTKTLRTLRSRKPSRATRAG